jgi:cardiolipin synthase A/B
MVSLLSSLASVVPSLPLGWFEPFEALLGAAALTIALIASGHALVYKRESRSAALWVIVIWTMPAVGAVLYLLLGINRVQRRAVALRRRMVRHRALADAPVTDVRRAVAEAPHLAPLAQLISQIVPRPLVGGNTIDPFTSGSDAFTAMLAAIDGARESIALASYIFDGHGIGATFVDALARAHARGVVVRVLIDDVDARFSRSTAVKPLRQRGVTVGIFNPTLVPARLHAFNLRNHRKLLVVDGAVGFTGGLNIDLRYSHADRPEKAFRDLHFRLGGPVVAQLMEVFADDWQFSTGESLRGMKWFPELAAAGCTAARGIEAGPDEGVDRLRWAIIGALNAAQHSVRVVTPYFIPDATLVAALNAAAMRGVEVDIFLPLRSDLPLVRWAMWGQLWQVLERGCHVWLSPGPFDHSKLLVVDGAWTLFGSANWDARSLRLNFEFNVECYCTKLGARLETHVAERRLHARRLSLVDVDRRHLLVKLRDGAARLFAPFL